jgi:hypothetical protein
MMFFTSNTAKANDNSILDTAVTLAQSGKPGNTLQGPWWMYYNVSAVLNPLTCCLEITVTHPWGGLHNVDVYIKRGTATVKGVIFNYRTLCSPTCDINE